MNTTLNRDSGLESGSKKANDCNSDGDTDSDSNKRQISI
jgi:hypothetical protein